MNEERITQSPSWSDLRGQVMKTLDDVACFENRSGLICFVRTRNLTPTIGILRIENLKPNG
jgi:hypothetical protein